ncbi:ATP-dependent Clp protease proteolytic subunit 6, chloroplastic isoform X2 [Rhododendron vialii]|uniref:ATP-dependent Clp protease proteolytic subunit 6, chloroplastic isoform X2 n=1 Tax=Rhododendron vialii TaxID=182163 RepID=UPI00265F7FE7|nr:ATP-dependent Clp protease proteolytic subunit 6, chloroplastic isoform X2 [Rhododendron vialii]
MAASALSPAPSLSISTRYRASALSSVPQRLKFIRCRNSTRSTACAFPCPNGYSNIGLSNGKRGVPLTLGKRDFRGSTTAIYGTIKAFMPAVMTPVGPVDLSVVLFRNRTIFIGEHIDAMVAQRVISQLVTLAAIDDADIWVYLNSYGGDPYSVFAIYDCMSWVKPKVGTVCFGMAASHATLVLAGGEKGMRYSMPNARIMIQQPRGALGGDFVEVKTQVNETVYTKNKIDLMYAAFTGQPLDLIQAYTERDRYFSAAEAADFGLIDGLMETAY